MHLPDWSTDLYSFPRQAQTWPDSIGDFFFFSDIKKNTRKTRCVPRLFEPQMWTVLIELFGTPAAPPRSRSAVHLGELHSA